MPVQSDKYKKAGHSLSLTLPVNFLKHSSLDVVISAYNDLLIKGRKKSAFIMDAIDYYDSLPERCEYIAVFNDRRRIAKKAAKLYSLKTKKDVKQFLSTPLDSDKFALINMSVPETLPPKKMLCGFRIGDPRAEAMHKRLCDMRVEDRVTLISKAVYIYVLDGMDEELESINVHRFVRDFILEYNNIENKDAVINNMMLMTGIK